MTKMKPFVPVKRYPFVHELPNARRIYEQADGSCVISECSCWIPGVYGSPEAATAAFELTPQQQAQLATASGGKRITLEDVLAAEKEASP